MSCSGIPAVNWRCSTASARYPDVVKLGIDFGTTRVVVAAVDRGNYPVVSFETSAGETCDWFPPVVAATAEGFRYGWDAWNARDDERATLVRSIKRHLHDAGPSTPVEIGGRAIAMLDLLSALAAELRRALMESSSLRIKGRETLEAMLGVPANSGGNQRFLTAEAFRRAGFDVLGLLNEPAAASIEHGHGTRKESEGRRVVLVYDLGGGTFDASLVEIEGASHTVIASEGIATMGGDDFDDILAGLALEAAGGAPDLASLSQAEWYRLHEECRVKKEALHPNTRRMAIDLETVRGDWSPVTVTASDFYERCRPLVAETIHATEDLIAAHGEVDTLYATGGASDLPLVGRMLRETFGRRVRRSAYSRSATAIGLAIQADAQAGYRLRDRFTRYFGVWREGEGGRLMTFDPLFSKGTPLPSAGQAPLCVARRYAPAHDIGHFRYLESSHLGDDGRPSGEITLWDEIRFPFDPALRDAVDLAGAPVNRSAEAARQQIEESFECDASGAVAVIISNLTSGYSRAYRLGRWAVAGEPVAPGKRRKPAAKKAGSS
jgi:molecular chaperone DnaK